MSAANMPAGDTAAHCIACMDSWAAAKGLPTYSELEYALRALRAECLRSLPEGRLSSSAMLACDAIFARIPSVSAAKHTPAERAVAYCAELRAYGLAPNVPMLMRGVRGLLRSQAVAAIAKATGGAA